MESITVQAAGLPDRSTSVVTASTLLRIIREPKIRDTDWDADYRKEQWEKTLKTLQGWGRSMVEVSPLGMTYGQFSVRLYAISPEQFSLLKKYRMAW